MHLDVAENANLLESFTGVWHQTCMVVQKLKIAFHTLESWVQKDNSEKVREQLESLGNERFRKIDPSEQ